MQYSLLEKGVRGLFLKILYSGGLKERSRDLRNNSTLAEVLLWNHLKRRKMLGYQFMRQKPIHHFIVDFYARS